VTGLILPDFSIVLKNGIKALEENLRKQLLCCLEV